WPASEGGRYNNQAVRQISPVLSRPASESRPYKTVAGGSHRWPASEGGRYNSQAVRQISPVLRRPASESRPYKTGAEVTQAEAYATKALQRRGAGAMVA